MFDNDEGTEDALDAARQRLEDALDDLRHVMCLYLEKLDEDPKAVAAVLRSKAGEEEEQ